jgi:hypothetical protein
MKLRNSPPKDAPWIWLSRDLVRSAAWRSQGINARRIVDCLMIEHMAKGGQHNGELKAPHRLLRALGIDAHYVVGAIREAEEVVLARADGSRVSVLLGPAETVAVAGDLIEAARLCIGRTGWPADAPALDGSDLRCR